MNKKLINVLMFTVGAAIGSVVTWKVIKTKYEQLAEEEIRSVREEYVSLMTKMKQNLKESATEEVKEDDEYYPDDDERDFTDKEKKQIEYYKLTSKYRSSEDDTIDAEGGVRSEDEDEEVPFINGPYVISPEDFNNAPPGYNVEPLSYFADGILADDWGYILDIDETIGEDAINHFGEDVDDIVYVRNERTEIDYEVAKDDRKYAEVFRVDPGSHNS